MSKHEYKHISVESVNGVTVVRFLDRRILDTTQIAEVREDLDVLKETGKGEKVVLVFSVVEYLSCAILNMLLVFDKRVRSNNGALCLCELKPEILEVFVITRLDRMYDIHDSVEEAIASFE